MLTGIKTLPLLDKSLVETGPWSALFARSGYRVYPYQMGMLVRSTSVGTAIQTAGLGEIVVGDYLLVCTATAYGDVALYVPNTSKITRVSTFAGGGSDPATATDDGVNVSAAVSVVAGDYLLDLGADSGAPSPIIAPAYDGSTLTLYTDNAGTAANANKYLLTGANGEFRGWLTSGTLVCDLLVTNASGVPIVVIPFVTLGVEVI